ncbi:MAG: chlorite dismutase family protein [Chloroflexota bacterium]
MNPSRPGRLEFTFVAGASGAWRIDGVTPVIGESLPDAARLSILEGLVSSHDATWALRGVTGTQRYTTRAEQTALAERQSPIGRAEATQAALIPIRKNDAWWALTQDERRAIFEDRSAHIARSMPYLPAIARRLHHGRDLGEPFDFLTWFEFAPTDAAAFEELLGQLRATEEWRYVDREVDVRVTREVPAER